VRTGGDIESRKSKQGGERPQEESLVTISAREPDFDLSESLELADNLTAAMDNRMCSNFKYIKHLDRSKRQLASRFLTTPSASSSGNAVSNTYLSIYN
jgi:hypothetical protein